MSSLMLDILSWFFAGVFSFLFILIIFHAFKINSINHNHVVLSIMCVFLIFFSVAYERLDEIPAPWNEMHVIKLRNRLTSKEMEQLIKLQRLILNLEIEESVQAPAPYLDEQIEHMKRKILEINWKLDFLKMIKHHVRDALKILDFRELSRELNLLEVEEEPSPYVYYWRARRAFYFSRNIDEAKCILDSSF